MSVPGDRKLAIAYLYPEELNLYGDTGNIEVLCYRARKRGIEVSVLRAGVETGLTGDVMRHADVVFMGGGPDAGQRQIYHDLKNNKGPYIRAHVEEGKPALFICGAYQLLGNYYKSSDGSVLEGLGVFNLHTEHFGNKRPRCIGNVVAELSGEIKSDTVFTSMGGVPDTIVGFENHGGRTYLDGDARPFARVILGDGNNGKDGGEGVLYKNSIGTYFHGPVLARNPHLADYIIAKSLGIYELPKLDDELILAAHTASKKLKR